MDTALQNDSLNQSLISHQIVFTIGKRTETDGNNNLDESKFQKAKNKGKELGNDILKQLFDKVEYGKIESHFNTERLNSKKLNSVREKIINLYYQREIITDEVAKLSEKHRTLNGQYLKTKNSIFRFLYKKKLLRLTEELEESRIALEAVKRAQTESYLNIRYEFETVEFKDKYSDLVSAFISLKNSDKIWDMTYSEANTDTKAAAQTSMHRNEVAFSIESIPAIKTNEKSFYFENYNGGDFYFYPSFIIYFKTKDDIAVLDYSDLQLHYSEARFLEESKNIQTDTEIVGETWYRVNRDGSPDKRFVNNYKIPIVLYGSIHIKTESGINELYYISDFQKAKHFCEQYKLYQSML